MIAAGTTPARIALSVYALRLMGLFGASAHHRINWRSVTTREWMRRLDHSMIVVLIAGSYKPFAVLVLHGPLAIAFSVPRIGYAKRLGRASASRGFCV